MKSVNINNANIFYEQQGQGEPLLLIAGFGADHMVWSGLNPELAKRYQVITFDNRGSGQSSITRGPYSIEQLAADAYELCQALGVKKAHVLGNSMGGYIAQMLAYRYPEFVSTLMLSNSAMHTNYSFHVYLEAQLELIKAGGDKKQLIKAGLAWCYSDEFLKDEMIVNTIIELMLQAPFPFKVEGYEAQMSALRDFNSTPWIQQLHCKTLVMSGSKDIIFLPSTTKALAEQLPNAEYYCFEGAGHLPFIEQPETFLKVITTFLEKR